MITAIYIIFQYITQQYYNLLFVYYITEINTRKIEAFTFANGTRNSHFKRLRKCI